MEKESKLGNTIIGAIVMIAIIACVATVLTTASDNSRTVKMAEKGYVECPDPYVRGKTNWVKSGECPAYQVREK